jgi:uncharacterized protein (DUF934 family)
MPKLFKAGVFVEDTSTATPSLHEWIAAAESAFTSVELQADEPPTPLLPHLETLQLVCIRFSNFMDGRGFSYARELRDNGYDGELRAVGSFIPDQLLYLRRCGFDCFEVADDMDIDEIEALLNVVDEHYQASADQPQPLSGRRPK